MGLSKLETETVITFNDADDYAEVYTCHRRIMTAMAKRGVEPTKEYKQDGRIIACTYEVPKKWIKISPPRQVSEKQREVMRQRMKARMNSAGV